MNKDMSLEQAWELTIKKWSHTGQSVRHFVMPGNCGLCEKFLNRWANRKQCTGCPVAKIEKHPVCKRFTAYQKFFKFFTEGFNPNQDTIEKIREQGLARLLKIKAKSEEA